MGVRSSFLFFIIPMALITCCCTVFLFFYYAVRIGVLFVRKDVQNRDGAVAAAAAAAEAEAEAEAEAPVIVLLGVTSQECTPGGVHAL